MGDESYLIHGTLGKDFTCKYVAAIHEAAHTSLALLCNGKVSYTSIKKANDESMVGVTSWSSTTKTVKDCKFVTGLAGIAAQQLFEDPVVRDLGPDTDRKQTIQAMWVERIDEENAERYEKEAIRQLRNHWPLVESIAQSLLEATNGVLGRMEILKRFYEYNKKGKEET